MDDVVGRPDRDRPPVLGRRARRALVVAAALSAAVGGWLWSGLHPVVTSQGLVEVLGAPPAGGGDRAWAHGPTGGRLVLELRNDGSLPFTASGAGAAPSAVPVEGAVRLAPSGRARPGPPAEAVTVAPGARAHLLLRAGLLPAYCQAPGAPGTARTVVLTVRTLGVPSTQRLSLPRAVQVVAPSPACR